MDVMFFYFPLEEKHIDSKPKSFMKRERKASFGAIKKGPFDEMRIRLLIQVFLENGIPVFTKTDIGGVSTKSVANKDKTETFVIITRQYDYYYVEVEGDIGKQLLSGISNSNPSRLGSAAGEMTLVNNTLSQITTASTALVEGNGTVTCSRIADGARIRRELRTGCFQMLFALVSWEVKERITSNSQDLAGSLRYLVEKFSGDIFSEKPTLIAHVDESSSWIPSTTVYNQFANIINSAAAYLVLGLGTAESAITTVLNGSAGMLESVGAVGGYFVFLAVLIIGAMFGVVYMFLENIANNPIRIRMSNVFGSLRIKAGGAHFGNDGHQEIVRLFTQLIPALTD